MFACVEVKCIIMLKSEPVNKLEPVYETETADYPN